MDRKALKLGVFGFGCVGQGLHAVLEDTPGIKAEIKKICVKTKNKERALPQHYFTYDKEDILNDPEINVIVELIDDAEAALEIVTAAMRQGKAVVTANKKMVAEHFEFLYNLQQEYNVPLLYEGAVCASIPIIRNLEEYYDNDLVNAIYGIFNGSTNYILTKIFEENKSFDVALKKAQEIGFAETDPTLDVGGFDPKYKLAIIIAHAYGIFLDPSHIFNYGIQHISDFDVKVANEKGFKIKLVARCIRHENEVFALVMPQFVRSDSPLNYIENEFNGVIVEGAFSEHQVFIGKGAGSYPTGSAVLSDISALTYDYRYEYKKYRQGLPLSLSGEFKVKVFVSYTDDNEVSNENFLSISEQYTANGNHYIIGEVSLSELGNVAWLDNPKVSVILTADSNIEAVGTVLYEEAEVIANSGNN